MKKKILLAVLMVAMLICTLSLTVFAEEEFTHAGKIDVNAKVTLSNGTEVSLFDAEGNALIWYNNGTEIVSVRADSQSVDYQVNNWASGIHGKTANQVDNLVITVDGTAYPSSSIVVFNIMDDDVRVTTSKQKNAPVGSIVNCITSLFKASTNLEYAYLRLDTHAIQGNSFYGASNLKYVNLESLTQLVQISGGASFRECTSLLAGKTLDLSNTQLITIGGDGCFAKCPFVEVKFPETLTSIGSWNFQQTGLVSVTLPSSITSISGSAIFKNCKSLKTVDLSALTLTSINSNMFQDCIALEDVKMPSAYTTIGEYAFSGCTALKGFNGETGITFPEGLKTVNKFAFTSCKAVTYIVFPSTINTINQQGFSFMDSLQLISFDAKDKAVKEAIKNGEEYTPLAFGNCGHFNSAKSLVAVSLPEGMVEVNNRAFANCTSLTAVYMPNSVKRLSSNGGGQGAYCGSSSMYFVQESFTVSQCITENGVDTSKLALPEKPNVYFMPTSLETFTGHTYTNDTWSNATMFKNCSSLNSVLVFPKSFTKMITMRPFEGIGTEESPKTLVFLGDIEEFAISHQSKYVGFIFANPSDTTFEDLGILRVTGNSNEKGSYAYFCVTGKWYDLAIAGRVSSGQNPEAEDSKANIAATINALKATEETRAAHCANPNLTQSTPADCVNNEIATTYCFCGAKIGTSEVENTKLGHEFDVADGATKVSIVYANYLANGTLTVKCLRCDEQNGSDVAPIISSFKGISVREKGNGLTFGYTIDYDALDEYITVNENKNVELGFVVAAKQFLGDEQPLKENGDKATDKVVKVSIYSSDAEDGNVRYTGADFVLKGNWDNMVDLDGDGEKETDIKNIVFYMAGYIVDGGELSFINSGASGGVADSFYYNQF